MVQEAKSQWEWAEDSSGDRPCRSCWPGSGSVVLLAVLWEAGKNFSRSIILLAYFKLSFYKCVSWYNQEATTEAARSVGSSFQGKPLWPYGPREQDQQGRQRIHLGTKNDSYWGRILCWEWVRSWKTEPRMFSMFLIWSRWTLVSYRERSPGTGAPLVGRETILFRYVWICLDISTFSETPKQSGQKGNCM